jgi:hypothetical protein
MDSLALIKSAALSIEFIAKPDGVHRLPGAILTTVQDQLGGVPGFAGCLVMASDREARVISLITFWSGAEPMTCGTKEARWVQDLLKPYVDHCLRVQTLGAYLGALGCSGGVVEREPAPTAGTRSEEDLPLCAA